MPKLEIKATEQKDIDKLNKAAKIKAAKIKHKNKAFGQLSKTAQDELIISALIQLGILDENEMVSE